MPDNAQAAILIDHPAFGHHLAFDIRHADGIADPAKAVRDTLGQLAAIADGEKIAIGIGLSLVQLLGTQVEGLKSHPQISAHGLDTPSTPRALWCWLRADDQGELLFLARKIRSLLAPAFECSESQNLFLYTPQQRDLSGFVDGTENPKDAEAINAAVASNMGPGLDGGSYLVVQKWLHDFAALDAIAAEGTAAIDAVMGRDRASDEELEDKPAASHVARTDQESFGRPAKIIRRNMPWANDDLEGGTLFMGFGRSFDAFELQWQRMLGLEDGITDALFRFTRPLTGAYYWCPPMANGKLDLRALGM